MARRRLLPGLALLAGMLAFAAAPAGAETGRSVTAADFYELCQSNSEQPRSACEQVILGFIEVYVLLGSKDGRMRVSCPPRRMPADQARFTFTAWAEDRRDLAGMDIGGAVSRALGERFPCADIDVSGRRRN